MREQVSEDQAVDAIINFCVEQPDDAAWAFTRFGLGEDDVIGIETANSFNGPNRGVTLQLRNGQTLDLTIQVR